MEMMPFEKEKLEQARMSADEFIRQHRDGLNGLTIPDVNYIMGLYDGAKAYAQRLNSERKEQPA